MPVYDFSNADDVARYERERPRKWNFGEPAQALEYALGLPSREKRVDFVRYVGKYYGREAAEQLVASLKRVAEERGK